MKIYELNASNDDEIFIKILNKKNMNKGKQIGWKLKDIEISEYKLKEAVKTAYSITPTFYGGESLREKFSFNPDGDHPYSFAVSSYCEAKLKEAALLYEMFDPVYENDRKHTGEKIIGYKLPVTIHEGCGPIHAGRIFVPYSTFPSYYIPKDTVNPEKYQIPKEIVETWEPVYEKEFIDVRVSGQTFRIEQGKIKVEVDNEISFADIQRLYEAVANFPKSIVGNKNKYDINLEKVKIGCSYFTLKDMAYVINTYKEFNDIK